jgi:hypothetical protein
MDSNSTEIPKESVNENNGGETEHTTWEKIEGMLNLGWILLPESCSIPTCQTPLLQSSNGDKYCVGCEAWYFDRQRPQKQKLGELIPISSLKREIQLIKNSDKQIQKSNKYGFDYVINQTTLQCLQTKLYFLISLLNTQSDITQIKEILDTIKICLENIKLAKNLSIR